MSVNISIIIPVYNELKFLRECVNTVINQNFNESYEIILVDDGSNNGAEKDCDIIALHYDYIKVIHKQNEGLSAARLTGLKYARGEWIMFMDHDDLVSPNILSDMWKYTNDLSIDLIACGRIDTNKPELVNWADYSTSQEIKLKGKEVVELFVKEGNQNTVTTPLWGKLYRRNFLASFDLEKYKSICPTIYFEDVLMMPIIYSSANNVCTLRSKLYIHREVSTSVSRSGKLSDFYYEQLESGDILLQYSVANGLDSYYRYQLTIYLRTLLRVFLLVPKYKSMHDVEKYDFLVRQKINKYKKDFFKYACGKFWVKCCYYLYSVSPKLLRLLYKLATLIYK